MNVKIKSPIANSNIEFALKQTVNSLATIDCQYDHWRNDGSIYNSRGCLVCRLPRSGNPHENSGYLNLKRIVRDRKLRGWRVRVDCNLSWR